MGLLFIHFFSKRNEAKKILLSPNPFLHIKGLNTKSRSTPSTFLRSGKAGHAFYLALTCKLRTVNAPADKQ